ncbi:MAG TPA: sigma-70 family RNA polymerase sigma factor [Gemmataceae bacterium]|nr:sigma-70 family RNA polymerase sigma factor [Gemmataceae bacterium]
MADSPGTRPSLLVRLRDPHDAQAWAQFVDVYAPLIYGYGRRHGLQDADAADLTQEVLRKVAGAIGRLDYDAQRGSFRGWLFTVVRNQLRDFLTDRRQASRGSGDTAAQEFLEEQPAPPQDPEADWEQECERRLFAWAAEQVRSEVQEATWQAFWMTAVEGKSGKETATALGMTAAAVYLAKSRVMARLKEHVRQLQEE